MFLSRPLHHPLPRRQAAEASVYLPPSQGSLHVQAHEEGEVTALERLDAVIAGMQRKLLEPVQHGPCKHAPDCPGHVGEVHWLGMSHALDELRAVRETIASWKPRVIESPGPTYDERDR